MLKQRPAGDKSWPVACSNTTFGEANKELDLSGAYLSYGDFEEATFKGRGAIKLSGAGLANADLSGSKPTAESGSGDATIDFTGANLAHADLSGSKITAESKYGDATINFAGRVEAERLVERRRGLPSRKAGMGCEKRCAAREA